MDLIIWSTNFNHPDNEVDSCIESLEKLEVSPGGMIHTSFKSPQEDIAICSRCIEIINRI